MPGARCWEAATPSHRATRSGTHRCRRRTTLAQSLLRLPWMRLDFTRRRWRSFTRTPPPRTLRGPRTHPWRDATHGWHSTGCNPEHLQPSRGPSMPCWCTGCRLFHWPPSAPHIQPCLWSRWNRSFDLLLLWSHLHAPGRRPDGEAGYPMATTPWRRPTQRWPLHVPRPASSGRCKPAGFRHIPPSLWQWTEAAHELWDIWWVVRPSCRRYGPEEASLQPWGHPLSMLFTRYRFVIILRASCKKRPL